MNELVHRDNQTDWLVEQLTIAFEWNDGRVADRTLGRVQFVVVRHAKNSIVHIDGEGNAVQRLVAARIGAPEDKMKTN